MSLKLNLAMTCCAVFAAAALFVSGCASNSGTRSHTVSPASMESGTCCPAKSCDGAQTIAASNTSSCAASCCGATSCAGSAQVIAASASSCCAPDCCKDCTGKCTPDCCKNCSDECKAKCAAGNCCCKKAG